MYNAVGEWRDVATEVVKYYEGSVCVKNRATSTTCKSTGEIDHLGPFLID